MSRGGGAIRLQKEFMQIAKRDKSKLENFVACPDPNNIFMWYYVIFGLKDCPYEDGVYMGKITFPTQYPLKPPGIEMITPNGRFKSKKKICMSMSDYHPESWNPAWHTQTILLGLISFMNTDELTTGCIITTDRQKRQLAKATIDFNYT
jgi:ubiquitin-conjugating enzyme E2 J2